MRYTMDIHFGVEAEKDAFVRRLSSVRTLLSGDGSMASIDNFGLMSAMFDIWKVLSLHLPWRQTSAKLPCPS